MKKLANGSAVIRSLAVIIIVVFFLFPVWLYAGSKSPAAAARDLGVVGNTYPVAEPDALQEIREKAKSMDGYSASVLAREVNQAAAWRTTPLPEKRDCSAAVFTDLHAFCNSWTSTTLPFLDLATKHSWTAGNGHFWTLPPTIPGILPTASS